MASGRGGCQAAVPFVPGWRRWQAPTSELANGAGLTGLFAVHGDMFGISGVW